jgi:hypothetical protein
MAKVTINQTPSAQVVTKAISATTVTDSAGRTITLKKPGVLAQYRLIEALGDTAKNEVYMAMAMPLIYVSEIDGDSVILPSTKIQVEALIQRLDEHGIQAVIQGMQENFGKSDPDADKAALKN